MSIALLPSEVILKRSGANYQKGWEAVGGKLLLTSLRLFFESHKINVNTGGLSIDLREVTSATPAWMMLFGVIPLVPNQLQIRVRDGGVYSFVIYGRAKWRPPSMSRSRL